MREKKRGKALLASPECQEPLSEEIEEEEDEEPAADHEMTEQAVHVLASFGQLTVAGGRPGSHSDADTDPARAGSGADGQRRKLRGARTTGLAAGFHSRLRTCFLNDKGSPLRPSAHSYTAGQRGSSSDADPGQENLPPIQFALLNADGAKCWLKRTSGPGAEDAAAPAASSAVPPPSAPRGPGAPGVVLQPRSLLLGGQNAATDQCLVSAAAAAAAGQNRSQQAGGVCDSPAPKPRPTRRSLSGVQADGHVADSAETLHGKNAHEPCTAATSSNCAAATSTHNLPAHPPPSKPPTPPSQWGRCQPGGSVATYGIAAFGVPASVQSCFMGAPSAGTAPFVLTGTAGPQHGGWAASGAASFATAKASFGSGSSSAAAAAGASATESLPAACARNSCQSGPAGTSSGPSACAASAPVAGGSGCSDTGKALVDSAEEVELRRLTRQPQAQAHITKEPQQHQPSGGSWASSSLLSGSLQSGPTLAPAPAPISAAAAVAFTAFLPGSSASSAPAPTSSATFFDLAALAQSSASILCPTLTSGFLAAASCSAAPLRQATASGIASGPAGISSDAPRRAGSRLTPYHPGRHAAIRGCGTADEDADGDRENEELAASPATSCELDDVDAATVPDHRPHSHHHHQQLMPPASRRQSRLGGKLAHPHQQPQQLQLASAADGLELDAEQCTPPAAGTAALGGSGGRNRASDLQQDQQQGGDVDLAGCCDDEDDGEPWLRTSQQAPDPDDPSSAGKYSAMLLRRLQAVAAQEELYGVPGTGLSGCHSGPSFYLANGDVEPHGYGYALRSGGQGGPLRSGSSSMEPSPMPRLSVRLRRLRASPYNLDLGAAGGSGNASGNGSGLHSYPTPSQLGARSRSTGVTPGGTSRRLRRRSHLVGSHGRELDVDALASGDDVGGSGMDDDDGGLQLVGAGGVVGRRGGRDQLHAELREDDLRPNPLPDQMYYPPPPRAPSHATSSSLQLAGSGYPPLPTGAHGGSLAASFTCGFGGGLAGGLAGQPPPVPASRRMSGPGCSGAALTQSQQQMLPPVSARGLSLPGAGPSSLAHSLRSQSHSGEEFLSGLMDYDDEGVEYSTPPHTPLRGISNTHDTTAAPRMCCDPEASAAGPTTAVPPAPAGAAAVARLLGCGPGRNSFNGGLGGGVGGPRASFGVAQVFQSQPGGGGVMLHQRDLQRLPGSESPPDTQLQWLQGEGGCAVASILGADGLDSASGFNTLIMKAANRNDRESAERLWQEMCSCCVAPDIQTLNALLRCLSRSAADPDEAHLLMLDVCSRGGFSPNGTSQRLMEEICFRFEQLQGGGH
ncbi:hypothetical protein CHLRE_11g467537v5 [Chlamydomonas reinhardtii]|uniref:Uncharacterized protein n=1 Tax=Chlamydomonas reinhardtii TaxID=3055 RepID=A0A2K3D776_CHLRE|nr:uncharacterized protein CHLRE_11g467537v5 [Chlamydomonas reinhardtii]PNW76381.1 hypothetical protein CHLRE_11g467537v5 [Chlamydomonas reinhardtii]